MLPYGRQSISEADIAAVAAVLRSDFLTQGPLIEEFERQFARRVGARHAVAVNSATAALHLAMRAALVAPGHNDAVIAATGLSSEEIGTIAAHPGLPAFVNNFHIEIAMITASTK